MDESLVMNIFNELVEESKGPRLCIRKNVYAEIILKNGDRYRGQNGCPDDPCTKKDFCTRDNGVKEFLGSCPSICAEGYAIEKALGLKYCSEEMIEALFYKEAIKGSTTVHLFPPCERCTGVLSDAKISTVVCGNYGGPRPRLKDALKVARMALSGIDVYQVFDCVDERGITEPVIEKIEIDPRIKSIVSRDTPTSGEMFLRMLFDNNYRLPVIEAADLLKMNVNHCSDMDPSSLIFPDELSYKRHH